MHKGNNVLKGCLQYSHVLPWVLNSQGNNFQVEMRLRFFLKIGLLEMVSLYNGMRTKNPQTKTPRT